MGINQLWRPAMLTASRSLRQNVVQGRIWGFGSTAVEEEEDEPLRSTPSKFKHQSLPANMEPLNFDLSTISERPDERTSGAHSEAEAESDGWIKRGMLSLSRTRAGKVKGMVASFERSASSSSSVEDDEDLGTSLTLPTSTASSDLSRSSPSLNNNVVMDYDLPSPDEYRHPGLVRAATSGSEGGDEDESEADEESVRGPPTTTTPGSSHTTFRHEDITPEMEEDLASPNLAVSPVVPPQTPPPSYAAARQRSSPLDFDPDDSHNKTAHNTPSPTIILTASTRRKKNLSYIAELSFDTADSKAGGTAEEGEHTISELLANIEPSGANAWLDQDTNGVDTTNARQSTAKKVFESVRSVSRKANPYAASLGASFSPDASPTRSKGSFAGRGTGTGGRASLASLFDPVQPEEAPVRTMAEVGTITDDERGDDDNDDQTSAAAQSQVLDGRREELLEHFRTRLEEVEKRLEEMEALDADREAEAERQRDEMMRSTTSASSSQPLTRPEADESPTSPTPSSRLGDMQLVKRTLAGETAGEDVDVDQENWVDPPLASLPSYVLLVGLGVCSVVMRVVFKRVVGTRVY